MRYREKLNIIFMRDNGPRRSIQMRRSNFFLLLIAFGCLPFLCALLATQCWLLWQENIRLREGMERVETDFQAVETRAERLENLEELLKEENVSGRSLILTRLAGEPAQLLPEAAAPEQEQGPGHEEFPVVDTGRVRVGNVQVRLMRGNNLRIGLDLRNPDHEPLLSGEVEATLVTADGERIALEFTPKEAGAFRISRFKRAVVNAKLPRAINLTNAQLILEVRGSDNKAIYRNIFAVLQ